MSETGWLQAAHSQAGVRFLFEALTKVRRSESLPKVNWRKRRLFACVCVRRLWPLLTDQRSRHAIEVAERYADQLADQEELQAAHVAARAACGLAPDEPIPHENDPTIGHEAAALSSAGMAARAAVLLTAHPIHAVAVASWSLQAIELAAAESQPPLPELPPTQSFFGRIMERLKRLVGDNDPVLQTRANENAEQCRLLLCVFGNPFRPMVIDRTWLSWAEGTVVQLAWAAHDKRAAPAGTLDSSHIAILADALEDSGCTNVEILSHLRSPGQHVRGCHVLDLLLDKQ